MSSRFINRFTIPIDRAANRPLELICRILVLSISVLSKTTFAQLILQPDPPICKTQHDSSLGDRFTLICPYTDHWGPAVNHYEVDSNLEFKTPKVYTPAWWRDTYVTTDPAVPGKIYYWRAKSVARNSQWSSPDSFELAASLPVPIYFNHPVPSYHPTFSWHPAQGAHAYQIQIVPWGEAWDSPLGLSEKVFDTLYRATKELRQGWQGYLYQWRVSSDNDYLNFGMILQVVIDSTFLPKALPLKPAMASDTALKLSFKPVRRLTGPDSVHYRLLVASNFDFINPLRDTLVTYDGVADAVISLMRLPIGDYWWKVSSEADFGSYSNPVNFKVEASLSGSIHPAIPHFSFHRSNALRDIPGTAVGFILRILNAQGIQVQVWQVKNIATSDLIPTSFGLAQGQFSFYLEFQDSAGSRIGERSGPVIY